MCLAKNNFIYFLGGSKKEGDQYSHQYTALTDADRYDLGTNTWNRIADLQELKRHACGNEALYLVKCTMKQQMNGSL